jgi:protein BUR2
VEETCRKTKDIVIACCRVAQKNPKLVVDEQTKDFWRWKDTILKNEDILLETICFDLTIESPYHLLFNALKYYNIEHNKSLRNTAWAFLNDSCSTPLCLLYNSRTIAAAALYLAARRCGVSFEDEDGKPWWEIQYANIRDIAGACNYMAHFYEKKAKEGDSIYAGLPTPEGDDAAEATRSRSSRTPQSPTAVQGTPSDVSMKNADQTSSSRKRKTESPHSDDERGKRQKTVDEGSEEGEVEE